MLENFILEHQNYLFYFLFLAAFFENIFPPLPGDLMVIVCAYLVMNGTIPFVYALIAATLGSFLGFMVYYYLGYKYGQNIFKWKLFKPLHKDFFIHKVERWFTRFGIWIVIGNRFFSGTRSVISITAGFFKMRPIPVTVSAFFSSLVWNFLIIYAVVLLRVNKEKFMDMLKSYNKVVGIVLLVAVVGGVIFYLKKRKRWIKEDANEIQENGV